MGKSVNIIGTIRGKVGSVVFSKGPKGETIMRSYQPQVSNPRTRAQLAQRAKVNMVGKLSKLIPIEALSGLGMGSRLANRSEFNSSCLRKAVAFSQQGVFTASILPGELVFSKGVATLGATLGAVTVATNSVSVALSNVNADGNHGVRLIAVVMQNVQGDAYKSAGYSDIIFEEGQTSAVVNLPVTLVNGDIVLLYACPMELDTSRRRPDAVGVWLETSVNGQLTENTSAFAIFGQSVFVSMNPFS